MTAVTTPADLTITPRDLKVDRNTRSARWWHGGDPIATAYFNALSAAFPQGETFFIEGHEGLWKVDLKKQGCEALSQE